jgi:hypothetical protein
MPVVRDDGGSDAVDQFLNPFGVPSPPPPSPTAQPMLGTAPTVSTTPQPGQGIALDVNGKLPAAVSNGLLQLANSGQYKIAFGSTSWTFSSSQTSDLATVNHGLGTTPTAVLITATGRNDLTFYSGSYTSTQFQTQAYCIGGALNTTMGFIWIAVG